MRVLMTEDSNHAISNSFLLDDDSRLVSFYQDLKDSKYIFFSIFVKKKNHKGPYLYMNHYFTCVVYCYLICFTKHKTKQP